MVFQNQVKTGFWGLVKTHFKYCWEFKSDKEEELNIDKTRWKSLLAFSRVVSVDGLEMDEERMGGEK